MQLLFFRNIEESTKDGPNQVTFDLEGPTASTYMYKIQCFPLKNRFLHEEIVLFYVEVVQ